MRQTIDSQPRRPIGVTLGRCLAGLLLLGIGGSVAHAQVATGIRPTAGRIQVSAFVVNAAQGAALGSRTLTGLVGASVEATTGEPPEAGRTGVVIGSARRGELSVVVESVASSMTGDAGTDLMMCRPTGARTDCRPHPLHAPVAIRPSSGAAESLLLLSTRPSGGARVLRATIASTAN